MWRKCLKWPAAIVLLGLPATWGAYYAGDWLTCSISATVALCLFGWTASPRPQSGARAAADLGSRAATTQPSAFRRNTLPQPPADASETELLVYEMVVQGRYALLLRPQIAEGLSGEQLGTARDTLFENMAVVMEGAVYLEGWESDDEASEKDGASQLVQVEPLMLDRYQVTNEQFMCFVKQGGYEQVGLWNPDILPAVLDFVDRTGHPGPRFWSDGCFPAGQEHHPVVGVSWYEACAYARWVGKRLPTDPEWVKAGAWPVASQGKRPTQRKYPWGNSMDRGRANLWGSHPIGGTLPVCAHAKGASVGEVHQLIGNVWEWMHGEFGAWNAARRQLITESPLTSLRGGAFDTYFDSQATCQFQSGDVPMARKHNIGFRCALSLRDVAEYAFDDLPEQQEALVGGALEREEVA